MMTRSAITGFIVTVINNSEAWFYLFFSVYDLQIIQIITFIVMQD